MREDWTEVDLQEVCFGSKGKKPPVLENQCTDKVSVPYINIKAFEKGIIDEYTNGEKCNLCEDGDLLMVWDGARAGLSGKARKGAVGSTLMKIEEVKGIEKQYLSYFLLSLYTKINTNPRGVGIPHVEPRILWQSKLLIVSSPIQRAIVSKIEALFSDLDNGIASFKKAQEQLKIYRQAVLKKAFEGGFSITNEELRITNEGNHNNQKNHSSDNLPKGWKWVKISEISTVVRGGSPRPAGDPEYYDGNIPFLKVRDITKDNSKYLNTYEFTIKEAGLHKTRQIKPNTLLLSNSGATLGVPKICMIDATMNDGIAAFLDLDARSNLYLYYFWLSKTKELRNINMGAAQPNLNTDIIKNYLVPYCSFEEQTQIVAEIERRLSVTDNLEFVIRNSIEKAEALRQSILKKAFEGKLLSQAEIEQCKQAADYEPASELLKKIKAEKLAKEQEKKKTFVKKESKK